MDETCISQGTFSSRVAFARWGIDCSPLQVDGPPAQAADWDFEFLGNPCAVLCNTRAGFHNPSPSEMRLG
jgi:hypothetical protein